MTDTLRCVTNRHGSATVLRLEGEADMATAPQLEEALGAIEREGSGTVVVDVDGLAFLDSTGLRTLASAYRSFSRAGRRFVLLDGSGPAHRVISVSGLDRAVEVIDDLSRLDG
jgi:anti-sigma B factor antagonist